MVGAGHIVRPRDIQTLERNIAALESRLRSLERAPAVPAGFQLSLTQLQNSLRTVGQNQAALSGQLSLLNTGQGALRTDLIGETNNRITADTSLTDPRTTLGQKLLRDSTDPQINLSVPRIQSAVQSAIITELTTPSTPGSIALTQNVVDPRVDTKITRFGDDLIVPGTTLERKIGPGFVDRRVVTGIGDPTSPIAGALGSAIAGGVAASPKIGVLRGNLDTDPDSVATQFQLASSGVGIRPDGTIDPLGNLAIMERERTGMLADSRIGTIVTPAERIAIFVLDPLLGLVVDRIVAAFGRRGVAFGRASNWMDSARTNDAIIGGRLRDSGTKLRTLRSLL